MAQLSINPDDNYEDQIRAYNLASDEAKTTIISKLLLGQRADITIDEDLFFAYNAKCMSMEDWMKQKKFAPLKEHMQAERERVGETKGWTKKRTMRLLGHIPTDVFYKRPEFSPDLPPEERRKNIRKFFKDFPGFKI